MCFSLWAWDILTFLIGRLRLHCVSNVSLSSKASFNLIFKNIEKFVLQDFSTWKKLRLQDRFVKKNRDCETHIHVTSKKIHCKTPEICWKFCKAYGFWRTSCQPLHRLHKVISLVRKIVCGKSDALFLLGQETLQRLFRI